MKLTKEEKSWILYDVANSAFILIITATLPIYFRSMASGAGVADNVITAWWGYATSISLFLLALIAPVLGAIADYKGYKKKLFLGFLVLAILAALSFTIADTWQAFLFLFVISRIGYSACNIFYDGMLIDVTSNERMNHVSSYGYAFGYIGSTIPFIMGVLVIFFGENIGLGIQHATQLSFFITIVWWVIFTIPLIKNVKQVHYLEPTQKVVRTSFKRVGQTMKDIHKDKKLFYFIIGYFFYIDGVYTIISMATVYGGEVGIGSEMMLLALLVTQFVAFPFAIMSSHAAKRFGILNIIKVCVGMYVFIAIFGFFLEHAWQFWFLAILIGMAQGGVQALSRSYFGQLIPKEKGNEYFGFFDIFGKFADFLGPTIIATSTLIFNESRYGVLMLVVLFIVGLHFIGKVQKIEATEQITEANPVS